MLQENRKEPCEKAAFEGKIVDVKGYRLECLDLWLNIRLLVGSVFEIEKGHVSRDRDLRMGLFHSLNLREMTCRVHNECKEVKFFEKGV